MEPESVLGLQDFQHEAVQQAISILERRRGVLIADSVGLGKTFVGLGLIERALGDGQRVLVLAPASLKRMWRSELRRLPNSDAGSAPQLLSHTQLARGHLQGWVFDLIVVDEAHAFRNPRTRRYRALRLLCRPARVVLITASPVNNSMADLYFQLRLFCSDRAFRDLGVGSLRTALLDDPRDVTRILRSVMIRRTRPEVRFAFARGSGGKSLRFPRRVDMHPVTYDMPMSPARVGELLASMTFPAYRIQVGRAFSTDLLRFGILKRMESSVHAIRLTLLRQIRFYEELIAALGRGSLLLPSTFRSLYDIGDGALQLVLEGVTLEQPVALPADLASEAARELHVLRAWHREMAMANDDKSARLQAIVSARPAGSRTIVFTEYRDTARHLWTLLRRRFPTALIDGSGAWVGENRSSRRVVLERFAPRANGGPAVHPRETISILVATDVLSEGMNLQDADAVISYDLPWNPIRLLQRAGRVDRMGSEHDVVSVYNFLPDREFDAFLGLAKTIRRKLEIVRASVGLERPVLEPCEDVESVARALREADSSILDRLEPGHDPELRRQFQESGYAPQSDAVPVAILPNATGRLLFIGVERGGESQEIIVQPQGGPRVRAFEVDRLLRRALGCNSISPCDPAAFIAVAEAELGRLNASLHMARDRRGSPAGAAARMVRRHLTALPFGTAPRLFDRADVLLTSLFAGLAPDTEDRIDGVLRREWSSPEDLIEAIEGLLEVRPRAAWFAAGWTLTAIIVAD